MGCRVGPTRRSPPTPKAACSRAPEPSFPDTVSQSERQRGAREAGAVSGSKPGRSEGPRGGAGDPGASLGRPRTDQTSAPKSLPDPVIGGAADRREPRADSGGLSIGVPTPRPARTPPQAPAHVKPARAGGGRWLPALPGSRDPPFLPPAPTALPGVPAPSCAPFPEPGVARQRPRVSPGPSPAPAPPGPRPRLRRAPAQRASGKRPKGEETSGNGHAGTGSRKSDGNGRLGSAGHRRKLEVSELA